MHDPEVHAIEVDDLILLVVHLGCAAKELRARRSEIGTAARCSVISAAGGRRPWMKVFVLGKGLADKTRSDDLAVQIHEAAIRLLRKDELRYAGHHRRI